MTDRSVITIPLRNLKRRGLPGGSVVESPPASTGDGLRSPRWEDPLEDGVQLAPVLLSWLAFLGFAGTHQWTAWGRGKQAHWTSAWEGATGGVT